MKAIWLDCDPGHDDATAIMLAVHCSNVSLLGVSTVHGNASHYNIQLNAARCLEAFGADPSIKVYPGAVKPLIRPVRYDSEIHGGDGLGGVEGLPSPDDPRICERLNHPGGPVRAIEAIAKAIKESWKDGSGERVVVISSGPMTNIALFVSVYPELLGGVEEFVFMGGAVGLGNRSAVAEFNILCDPEAAQIVLDAPVKKIMIPLNVTHTAIFTKAHHSSLLNSEIIQDIAESTSELLKASSPLRHMLSTLLGFFASTYKSTFGFHLGPPIHDALTVAYVSQPELFRCTRYRVDVELNGTHTSGETVVDIWNYRETDDTWGNTGKNTLVAETLDVDGFFKLFMECVVSCDKVSPLNH
ncbi:unnamed protein product [Somion occarium]|uniref:Inosine/uridine-preferring nucleoside hydrolase domain-containing protein n=1 Tax=Somion occarium TaxID=3059160 RepID=A0ABP1CXR1_9APHY